jgi:cobalt/nickel transport protein
MSSSTTKKNIAFWLTGLAASLLIAGVVSPFASPNPDGLDRVSQDHGFDTKAQDKPPAHKLPFYSIFDQYALRGVPSTVATPLAGVIGTLVAFGLAWGVGSLLVKPGADSPGPDGAERE